MGLVYLAPRDQRHFLVLGPKEWRGEVRNGWNVRGRGTGLRIFFIPPNMGLPFPQKTASYALRKYLLGSEKSGGVSLRLIFHLVMSTCVQGSVFVDCA